MRKAGGIVALIAGIFAVLATIAAVMLGLDQDSPTFTMALLFGGLLISFIVIVLSAVTLNSRSPWPGALIVVASIYGIANNWGGGFVTIFLVLATIGGIMTLFARNQSTESF